MAGLAFAFLSLGVVEVLLLARMLYLYYTECGERYYLILSLILTAFVLVFVVLLVVL